MPKTKHDIGSIALETVWLPFLEATNDIDETAIPREAFVNPRVLAHNPDGDVKFSKSGKPQVVVNKDISEKINLVEYNFKRRPSQIPLEKLIESLRSEIEQAIAKHDVSLELRYRVKALFLPPISKSHIHTFKGSVEMGKRR
jgi:hypothetical protein